METLKSRGKNVTPINYFKMQHKTENKHNCIHTFHAQTESWTYSTLQIKTYSKEKIINQGKENSKQCVLIRHAHEIHFLISRAMNSELKYESNKIMPEHETQLLKEN